jgi:hypothetical protein
MSAMQAAAEALLAELANLAPGQRAKRLAALGQQAARDQGAMQLVMHLGTSGDAYRASLALAACRAGAAFSPLQQLAFDIWRGSSSTQLRRQAAAAVVDGGAGDDDERLLQVGPAADAARRALLAPLAAGTGWIDTHLSTT